MHLYDAAQVVRWVWEAAATDTAATAAAAPRSAPGLLTLSKAKQKCFTSWATINYEKENDFS